MDQSTEPPACRASLNTNKDCLRIVDTLRGVTDVSYRHYRGRGYYGNPGAAIGLGILGAAAGAAAYGAYGPGYYAPGYYGPGYYGPGYYGAPYPYRRHYYYPY